MDAFEKYLFATATSVQEFTFDRSVLAQAAHGGPYRGRNGVGRGRTNNSNWVDRVNSNSRFFNRGRGGGIGRGDEEIIVNNRRGGRRSNGKFRPSKRQLKYQVFRLKKQLEKEKRKNKHTNETEGEQKTGPLQESTALKENEKRHIGGQDFQEDADQMER